MWCAKISNEWIQKSAFIAENQCGFEVIDSVQTKLKLVFGIKYLHGLFRSLWVTLCTFYLTKKLRKHEIICYAHRQIMDVVLPQKWLDLDEIFSKYPNFHRAWCDRIFRIPFTPHTTDILCTRYIREGASQPKNFPIHLSRVPILQRWETCTVHSFSAAV